jgi:hypothetical protein
MTVTVAVSRHKRGRCPQAPGFLTPTGEHQRRFPHE